MCALFASSLFTSAYASEAYNVDKGTTRFVNDGDSTRYVIKGGRMGTIPFEKHRDAQVAHPLPSAPTGYGNGEILHSPKVRLFYQNLVDKGLVDGLLRAIFNG